MKKPKWTKKPHSYKPFVNWVKKQVSSPEMQKMMIESENEQNRYTSYAAKRRHVLTPQETECGRELLARGNFGIKDTRTPSQIRKEEEEQRIHDMEEEAIKNLEEKYFEQLDLESEEVDKKIEEIKRKMFPPDEELED